ncbi:MAG: 6-carboxytetrahydropterin synthase [Pseudomonadota bacterium]
MIYVTKAVEFSATHRLYNPDFDDRTNQTVFGKCNNPNGHGHNYRLEVAVRGGIDSKTGMAFDLGKLRQILEEEILTRFDHKNLNLDVSEMKGLVPTAENIAAVIWKIVAKRIGAEMLHRVRLFETQNNFVEFLGEK